MGKKLISIKDLANMLSLPKGSIYNKVLRREIPFVKIGRRTLFDVEKIYKWIDNQSVE